MKKKNVTVCTSIVTLKECRIFNPVSEFQQMLKCKPFKLQLTKKLIFEGKFKILIESTTTISIVGGGNGFYRAICN